jgi:D-beta-D-heptose 7-phosphate kinase/D-beta-D-heptose 1-phosphate adenosyltransferase
MQDFREWLRLVRRANRLITFTNGCFDLFHAGHALLLDGVQALAPDNLVVVGVNSDRSVRALKGPGRPVVPEEDRLIVVGSHRAVARAVLFNEDTPTKLICLVRPQLLVKGGDHSRTVLAGQRFVESCGGRIAFVPYQNGALRSTTKLVEKIQA